MTTRNITAIILGIYKGGFMTKLELRHKELAAHYKALESLAKKCGVKVDGKKLSVKLLHLEHEAHRNATDYCNGDMEGDMYEDLAKMIEDAVLVLFDFKLNGFFINGDPHGYSLKIKDDILKAEYADCGLHRDWGGYGLLAPEIK